MSHELLPCPFCGGDANEKPHSQHLPGCYFDAMASLKAAPKGDLSMAPEVVRAWNRRATQPAAGEPVAWLLPEKLSQRTTGSESEWWWTEGWNDCLSHLAENAQPAAAHGDEAVRSDAQAAYLEMTCQPVLIDGATHYYLSSERMQAFDRLFSVDVSDAAMRDQGDGD